MSEQAIEISPNDIEPPRDARGYIDWKTFQQDPDNLKKFIESEAERAVAGGLRLTQADLATNGFSGLSKAIGVNYEGGFPALRSKVSGPEVQEQKPNGYWKNPETIEREVRAALERGVSLKAPDLHKAGLSSLSQAITDFYPGGKRALYEKINSGITGRRPEGYWENLENIENELERLIAQGIDVTSPALRDIGQGALAQAISDYYPGGFYGVREKYNISETVKPVDYWKDSKRIEDATRELLDSGVNITSSGLRKSKNYDLYHAVSRWYEGGFTELRKKLGIKGEIKKENGYWKSEETIEREARKARELGVELTPGQLANSKLGSLGYAIRKYYRGGFPALVAKLELDESSISPDEADEMMRRLEAIQ